MLGRGRRPALTALSIAAVAGLAAAIWVWKESSLMGRNDAAPQLIGSASCAGCHPAQYSQWLESNHRHAMETPSAKTVLGDFNDTEFHYFGRTTRFFKTGDSFSVTTENQQGQPETFRIAYTLGYKPLQQYLVDVGKGRIQALPFAWDSREEKDGGQRWFHLSPKDDVTPGNPLFWTRPMQNWNHMCGDCHTTGFSKNFSAADNTFASRWREIGNGCESCHGDGSAHANARKISSTKAAAAFSLVSLPRTQKAQIDQCGACHSRRVRLREAVSREHMLETMLETWRPQLPQNGLYFVDGQIREEVFEIGSFLQSRMAARGVRCTDCHDPHTSRLKAEGNALCTQCHDAEKLDRVEHHFHKPGTAGAQCVSCHMPARTYMIVDPRRDHRLAIPRPDLSDSLGTPNPCTGCHTDRSNAWAAETVRKQVARTKGRNYEPKETWGEVAWQILQESRPATEFVDRLNGPPVDSVIQSTLLASFKTLDTLPAESLRAIPSLLNASKPLAKLGAIQAIGSLPPPQRSQLLMDQVRDSSLAVRMEAASLLAGTDRTALSREQRDSLDAAVAEYRKWLEKDADRAEAMAALASLQTAEGDVASAQASFEKALQRDETSLTALLNYADFHRAQGHDTAAEPLLIRASTLYPEAGSVHFALGLLRVRQKRYPEAVPELALAAQLSPDEGNYTYVYAVSLYSTGQASAALSVLDKARIRFPASAEIASALKAYCAEQRNSLGAACSGSRFR